MPEKSHTATGAFFWGFITGQPGVRSATISNRMDYSAMRSSAYWHSATSSMRTWTIRHPTGSGRRRTGFGEPDREEKPMRTQRKLIGEFLAAAGALLVEHF